MQKSALLSALKTEIQRHDFSHFQDQNIVVLGCPTCRMRINTMSQFLDHLTDDVLPGLLDRLSVIK
jgi:hypothetical protein